MKNKTADLEDTSDNSHAAQEWRAKAREAGAAALDATRATYQQLHDKTLEYTKATDRAIHEKPYVAIGAAFGVGLLLGYLVAGRRSSIETNED